MTHARCLKWVVWVGGVLLGCVGVTAHAGFYSQTNLVSDIPGLGQITDPALRNPWGISHTAASPFWVSDQATGVSTLYNVTAAGASKAALQVTIPTTASGPQGPTGQVNNTTTVFPVNGTAASFIFANLNGTVSAWNNTAGTTAVIEATTAGAIYTGLALGGTAAAPLLYAANDSQNRIDVFSGSFSPVDLGAAAFVDAAVGSLVPFNIQNIGGNLYVTYAPAGRPAQISAPEGVGAVAVFDMSGHLLQTLITDSRLASPWGLALAPAGFGDFGGDLLVGNFSFAASEINAFNPVTGAYVGTIPISAGANNTPGGLWGLSFGTGGNNGNPNTLYFASGINGEADGLFGAIAFVPEPATIGLLVFGLLGSGFRKHRRAA